MRSLTSVAGAALGLSLLAASACTPTRALPPTPPEPQVVVDQEIPVPGRTSRTRLTELAGVLTVSQTLDLAYEQKQFRFETTVTYATQPSLHLTGATARTYLGKTPLMEGSVNVTPTQVAWKGNALAEDDGRAIPAPRPFAGSEPLPAAPLLLQTAVEVMAPRLLAAPGELEVAYVEFPDDSHAPELVSLMPGHRLVRDPPSPDGSFRISLVDSKKSRTRHVLSYDPRGLCVAVGWGASFPVQVVQHAR